MSKSQPIKGKSEGRIGEKVLEARREALEIGLIRALAEELSLLPRDAPLPDWTHLSVGNRFMVVSRLIPEDRREHVLKRSLKQLARYQAGTEIPLLVVAAAAAETGIPLEWIVSGRPMKRLLIAPGNHDITGFAEAQQPYEAASVEDVPVQKLAFKAAAGPGALMLDDSAEHVRVPRAILAHAGVAPQNARLMEASGESMRTTINDGDLMVVDVSPSATTIVEGKIYVFSLGNEAYVKRLRRTAGKVVMISDNREMFPPEEVPAHLDMRIYGRVMWAGRNL